MVDEVASPASTGEVEIEEEALIRLDLLRTIKLSQNQYGIRHGSYQHYRHYCTRKLVRLRKSLKLTNGGKRYTKKEIKPDSVTSERYLLVPLYQAERAWAYAMQLKDEAGPSEVPPRVFFHLVRRFKKAITWCQLLATLADGRVDDKTHLEIEAYTSWMAGNLLLETEQWNEVIENLVKARTIYERMAKLGDPEEQELYRDRVIEIDTSLRFCHFNQNGGTIDDIKTLVDTAHSQQNTTYDLLNAKLENVLQETRKRQSTGLDKIQWRGRTVPIKSDKIRSALVSAEDIRTELSNGTKSTSEKLVTYGNLFMAYGDTLEAIRSEQRQLAAKSANQKTAKSETEDGNHTYLIKYISYLKLTKTVERNVILAESLSDSFLTGGGGKRAKPDELVRIYDSLIQNYKELEEIGEAEEVETKKALVAKGLSCRALRCYYLALTYINSYEWSKGLALLNRCLAHAGAAKEHHLDCSNIDKADVAEMDRLVLRIQGEKSLVKAKAYLDTLQAEEKQQTSGSLADNLDVFSTAFADSQQLANFPPEFRPTTCKPILFDLAHLELEFPSLEPAPEKKSFWKFW